MLESPEALELLSACIEIRAAADCGEMDAKHLRDRLAYVQDVAAGAINRVAGLDKPY